MTNERATNPKIKQEAGRQIRIAREEKGWSQARLAQEAKTSQQTVDRIERGVTGMSRAYPRIMQVLGLTRESGPTMRILDDYFHAPSSEDLAAHNRLQNIFGNSEASIDAVIKSGHMPIYARVENTWGEDQGLLLTDAVPRPYPVALIEGAYGLMVSPNDMLPAFRSGDIAVVNPILPLNRLCEVVFFDSPTQPSTFHIRTLLHEADDHWVVKQWHPEKEETISKSEWTVGRMIVSRISRYR